MVAFVISIAINRRDYFMLCVYARPKFSDPMQHSSDGVVLSISALRKVKFGSNPFNCPGIHRAVNLLPPVVFCG